MFPLLKKIIAVLMIASLVFPFEADQTEAASTTLIKTVEYSIGQESTVKASGEYINFPSFTIDLPESSVAVRSAIIEVNGVSYNNTGNQTVTIDLRRNTDLSVAYAVDYTLGATAKPKSFKLQYDAFKGGVGPMSDITSGMFYAYTLYVKDTVSAGSVSFSVASAKLILTYDSAAIGSNFLKETKFFIVQQKNSAPSGSEVVKDFTLTIPESSPEIKSVFVEISGVAKGNAANGVIDAKVVRKDPVLDPGYTSYALNLNSPSCVSACSTPFLVRYDATATVLSSDFPVGKDYTFQAKGTGFSTDLWNAKLIVTYKYTKIVGNLPPKGELISSTFDTWDGVRASGAAYNSLMWKGSLNSGAVGQVGLQIAASDLAIGPWVFEGPDCTSLTKYSPDANTPMPIEMDCAASHNNKRYFRYKVIICSNIDCATSGSINPQVDEVVVNWTP